MTEKGITVPAHSDVTKLDGQKNASWLGFVCGHCGTKVSGKVIASWDQGSRRSIRWLLCPECARGSVRNDGVLVPGSTFGPEVEGLSEEVAAAYDEARQCMKVNAHTAAELLCRKLLMHVAVEKGAKEGESFASYVTHLESI